MSAGEEKLEFPERGNAALWGAHAARVLVLAARQNNLLCQESSRPAKAFGVASTRLACASQKYCCAPDPRSFASRYGEPAGEAAGDGAGVPKLKFTAGALSAPGCAAKNGRGAKPNIPAIKFVGKLRTAVL